MAFGSGVGLILQSPTEELLEQAIQLSFPASNNEAEYEVVLARLDLALTLAATKLEICNNSQLIVGQIQKECEAKDKCTTRYLTLANALAGRATTLPIRDVVMLPVYLHATSSVASVPVCSIAEADPNWMHEIVKYLQTGELPRDEKHAHKVRVQAARFTLINDSLYRRSFGGPYLKCLSNPKAQYVLAKLHEVRSHPRMPSKFLNLVTSPWSFALWEMDIVGLLPLATTQKKFLPIATNYVSKVPQVIIEDNGPQFDNITFKIFCSKLKIKNLYSMSRYPQNNGQAEATNKTLLTALKKRLE
ncbi:hypothetical protein CK203_083825 [Vitis vinifera]|uniref:Integrase catalytic domain-containing protein n=1 Tax=Vitis vinifera TaxID=29760 RepID=A0A438DLT5_VITVI|nr:hypothetical protein CK203_083825 [Vitis vinifera]